MSETPFSEGLISSAGSKRSSSGVRSDTTVAESAGDEEQEEPSSSNNNENVNNEDVLANFREKWQMEISNEREDKEKQMSVDISAVEVPDNDALARKLFLQGVEHEQKGLLYEAIQFYKKAVQLVPDIEFKLDEPARPAAKDISDQGNESSEVEVAEEITPSDDENLDGDEELFPKLQRWLTRSPAICKPAVQQKATHISSLPLEILLYIFRWVVSCDLDIRSLEMCGLTCRGFYICSRDSEIWRLICLRLWGVKCGGLSKYLTWRDMYVNRAHLNFSGCYISKTSYIRHGENSFQDQFYRPWHVVEYFRYLRFFPEGRVLMMTTPDGPVPVLGLLKHRSSKNPVVRVGHYRLTDDKVTVVIRRDDFPSNKRYVGRGRRQSITEDIEQTFTIELQVKPWKSRQNYQLVWTRYMVYTRRGVTETVTNFEVMSNKFPPFWFSRVKSYCNESEFPLE